MHDRRYFDNAATTAISDEALKTYMNVSTECFANPSSKHKEGLKAKKRLEDARLHFASMLHAKPENIFFTSGASESIAQVLSSLLWAKRPGRVIFSAIEHEAVLSYTPILKEKGFDVVTVKARGGFVKPEDLEALLTPDTKLVAIQYVNNVVGSVNDIKSLVSVVRKKEKETGRKIFFLSDCVQALGKLDVNLASLDVDGAAFSAHKISGPRGVGLLYLKRPELQVLAKAGGQERGVRGGTENLPAIAAFETALETYRKKDDISELNAKLRSVFESCGIKVLSPDHDITGYVLTITTPLPSEVLTRMLSDEGYSVSSGSACSNNAKGKSENVIIALGYSMTEAKGTVRISFSPESDEEEALALAKLICDKVKEFTK
ncbi:MAG: cysteine desulfurase family protein [Bullifex sp.]